MGKEFMFNLGETAMNHFCASQRFEAEFLHRFELAVAGPGTRALQRARPFSTRSLAVILIMLAGHGTASAQNRTWLGGSGSWSVASNWTPSGVPVQGDTVEINGPVGTSVTMTADNVGYALVTVRAGNTLGNANGRLGWGSGAAGLLVNEGIIENANVVANSATPVNSGTIQASGTSRTMTVGSSFNNTAGVFRAVDGGNLSFGSGGGDRVITNGHLIVDSTSRMEIVGANFGATLNAVTAVNNGTVTVRYSTDTTSTRSQWFVDGG
jgi:hypothetical protein